MTLMNILKNIDTVLTFHKGRALAFNGSGRTGVGHAGCTSRNPEKISSSSPSWPTIFNPLVGMLHKTA